MSSNASEILVWMRRTLMPLLLMLVCPPTVFLIWYANVTFGGSLHDLYAFFAENGFFTTLYAIGKPVFFGTPIAWKMVAAYIAVQLVLMKVIPGKSYEGPPTSHGNIPIYKINGLATFLVSLGLFYVCAYPLGLFSPTIIYDNFGALLGALNLLSMLVCLFLYFKGKFSPSTSDSGTSGNVIFDYFWGTELHPRLLGQDVKMFAICRLGMISWALILLSFAAKQQVTHGFSDSMFVSVALQLLFIAKFFLWERGYLRSLDIMHDRAGYYLCWGCLVWLPGVYTSPTLYLVNHPYHMGPPLVATLLILGTISIIINYLADRQRQHVRTLNGECLIWGKKPSLIIAGYITKEGASRQNILLASGWWGISRHFHYIPEIMAAFFWSVPALFTSFLPYFYLIFLTLLLTDRIFRHDKRCADKYGADWKKYCELVPYKVIPYLF
jgi:7-dehydrocholesterol reductase